MHNLAFVARLLQGLGHSTYFLTCDSSVPNCYNQLIRQKPRLIECTKCILGGVRSFFADNVTSFSNTVEAVGIPVEVLREFAKSSSYTIGRTESSEDTEAANVRLIQNELIPSIQRTYESAKRWIAENKLDGVFLFNGRIDLTRALLEASKASGIPFVSMERSLFGDGILFNPGGNCLSLNHIRQMNIDFRSKSLDHDQAVHAAMIGLRRFLVLDSKEWRVYLHDRNESKWPAPHFGTRVLVLPSSRNEFQGHPDWDSDWANATDALDDILDMSLFPKRNFVVRGHPNWAEHIGKSSGERSERHYREWADSRGLFYIPSSSRINTHSLIKQADVIIVNGSSSAIQAGILGKLVILLGHAPYENSNMVLTISQRKEMQGVIVPSKVDAQKIIASTLRYLYTVSRRFPQFTRFVKARTALDYVYYEGADGTRLERLLASGRIEPDDDLYSQVPESESEIVSALLAGDWDHLLREGKDIVQPQEKLFGLRRRGILTFLDPLRSRIKPGDR